MKRWNQLSATALLLAVTTIGAGCAGGDFTTREKGAGIGALGGAAAGGAIGAAVVILAPGLRSAACSDWAPVHWSEISCKGRKTSRENNKQRSISSAARSRKTAL